MKVILNKKKNLAYDLLEKLFELDYKKRITATEALEHPYLSELHNPEDEVIFLKIIMLAQTRCCFKYGILI